MFKRFLARHNIQDDHKQKQSIKKTERFLPEAGRRRVVVMVIGTTETEKTSSPAAVESTTQSRPHQPSKFTSRS